MKDKNQSAILKELSKISINIITTKIKSDRSENPLLLSSLVLSLVILLALSLKWKIPSKVSVPSSVIIGILVGLLVNITVEIRHVNDFNLLILQLLLILGIFASFLVWRFYRNPERISPEDADAILSPADGKVIQKGRLRRAGSHFYASPVAADDKIFIISLKGKISVLKPGGGLDILAQGDFGEDCYASPAIADGRLYIRTVNTLYCFSQK